jgi:hypothetical protein
VKCFSVCRQYRLKARETNRNLEHRFLNIKSDRRQRGTVDNTAKTLLATVIAIVSLTVSAHAGTRILESRFALSADNRSEFSTSFPLLSAGRILVEVNWNTLSAYKTPISLTVTLIQPDGSIAASKSGVSALRIDYVANDQDFQRFGGSDYSKWTVKILNNADTTRSEVSGVVRVTVPAASRALEDTQFTLLGLGNAQEIPFNVPAAGRIDVNVNWEINDLPSSRGQVPLVVSLVHPGESRTYARRQGPSPVTVEQQVTEQTLDRGQRWIIRVQNDTQTKVKGRIEITYTPSL